MTITQDTTTACVNTGSGQACDWLTAPFRSLTLAQLDAKADMLYRRDNKYVVPASCLARAIPWLAPHFDILEIDGRRDFTYDTCYFDDAARTSYFDQHKARRKRCKVRTRTYVDAGLCFVEIKLKAKRGITIKKRMACEPRQHGTLDDTARAFVEAAYREQYDATLTAPLLPVLGMRYRRATLVAREGGERMTIDFALTFNGTKRSRQVADGVYLLETKSNNANGVADKVLRALHQHPTHGCSKYCVGMAAVGEISKCNKFLPALRKLDMMPQHMHKQAMRVVAPRGPVTTPWPVDGRVQLV